MPKPNRKQNRRRDSTWTSAPIGVTSQSRSTLLRQTIVRVPKALQMFPDEYECWGSTDIQVVPTGSGQTYTFKANSPFNLFGPQTNFTGAFAANVPAGAYYLISSNTLAGATAPYRLCTVLGLEIQLEITNSPGNASPASYWTIMPSEQASLSGASVSQVLELRGNSHTLVPGATSSSGMLVPITVQNKFTIADLLGVTDVEVRTNKSYSCTPGSDPTFPAYFHVFANAYDGVTNMAHICRIRIRTHYLFRGTNTYVSAVPA